MDGRLSEGTRAVIGVLAQGGSPAVFVEMRGRGGFPYWVVPWVIGDTYKSAKDPDLAEVLSMGETLSQLVLDQGRGAQA